jgi:hypothetical protein
MAFRSSRAVSVMARGISSKATAVSSPATSKKAGLYFLLGAAPPSLKFNSAPFPVSAFMAHSPFAAWQRKKEPEVGGALQRKSECAVYVDSAQGLLDGTAVAYNYLLAGEPCRMSSQDVSYARR